MAMGVRYHNVMKQKGITLIELILVLAISAFMIVLALGGVTNRGRAQFDDGMRQVLNNLRTVQNEAVSGQWEGKTCTTGLYDNCIQSKEELVGKAVTFSTVPGDVEEKAYGCTSIHTKNFNVKGSLSAAYLISSVTRGAGTLRNTVGPRMHRTVAMPANVRLESIKLSELPTISGSALVVFARSAETGQVNSIKGSSVPPHVFGQAAFSQNCTLTAAQTLANYDALQTGTLELRFVNPDNKNMGSTIIINRVTGAMELKS